MNIEGNRGVDMSGIGEGGVPLGVLVIPGLFKAISQICCIVESYIEF